MKIQCDVCERASATILCCADEAALCSDCDSRIHAANKLASKHHRLPLITPSTDEFVYCDICQEKKGFFFCLEDRALLCRACDLSIHSSNALTLSHTRFLITGLRVGLLSVSNETAAAMDVNSSRQGNKKQKNSPREVPKMAAAVAKTPLPDSDVPSHASSAVSLPPPPRSVSSISGSTTLSNMNVLAENGTTNCRRQNEVDCRDVSPEYYKAIPPPWHVDELLNIPDVATEYCFGDIGSSKANASNLRDIDWNEDLSFFEEQAMEESLGQVPELSSPPTFPNLWRSSRFGGIPITKTRLEPYNYSCMDEDMLLVPNVTGQSSPTASPYSSPAQK